MKHYLGPWEFRTDEIPAGCWYPPRGTVALLDLRPIADQGVTALGQRPIGFFSTEQQLGSDYDLVVDGKMDAAANQRMRDVWQGVTGYTPTGGNLKNLLWDHLTNGSNRGGVDRSKPLIPKRDGFAELRLGGNRLVRRKPNIRAGGAWESELREQMKADMVQLHQQSEDLARKNLTTAKAKYALRDDELGLILPSDMQDLRPLPPTTSGSDDFNRGDEPLQTSADWDNPVGAWNVLSNGVTRTNSGHGTIVFQTAMSSADHWAEISWLDNNDHFFAVARKENNTTVTAYFALILGTQHRVHKYVNGVESYLGHTTDTDAAAVIRVDCEGSTIKHIYGGVEKTSVTDTSITGGLYAGLGSGIQNGASPMGDDFAFDDGLGGGGGGGGGDLGTMLRDVVRSAMYDAPVYYSCLGGMSYLGYPD